MKLYTSFADFETSLVKPATFGVKTKPWNFHTVSTC